MKIFLLTVSCLLFFSFLTNVRRRKADRFILLGKEYLVPCSADCVRRFQICSRTTLTTVIIALSAMTIAPGLSCLLILLVGGGFATNVPPIGGWNVDPHTEDVNRNLNSECDRPEEKETQASSAQVSTKEQTPLLSPVQQKMEDIYSRVAMLSDNESYLHSCPHCGLFYNQGLLVCPNCGVLEDGVLNEDMGLTDFSLLDSLEEGPKPMELKTLAQNAESNPEYSSVFSIAEKEDVAKKKDDVASFLESISGISIQGGNAHI